MSYTPVQNRIWSDGWFRQLNALDRYLFLFILTNGRAGRTGIYELPLDLMASESGIDEKDLRLSMLQRLEPKVFYKEGWVIMVNYTKYLIGDGPKFWTGVRNSFLELPPKIQELAKDCGYPIHTLSIPYNGFSNRIEENRIDIPNVVKLRSDTLSETEDSETAEDTYSEGLDNEGEEIKPRWGKKPKEAKIRKNEVALGLVRTFSDMCETNLSTRPLETFKDYSVALRAINSHNLTREQVNELFEDWFSKDMPPENQIQLSWALSANNINKFRANRQMT